MEFLDLKVPEGFAERCTTQKIFEINIMTKTFVSKLLSQCSIEQDSLSKNGKNVRFGEFNENINFSTKFQY